MKLKLNDELAAVKQAMDRAREIIDKSEAGVNAIIKAEKKYYAAKRKFLNKCRDRYAYLTPPENAINIVTQEGEYGGGARVGCLAYAFVGNTIKTPSLKYGRGEGIAYEFGEELTLDEKKNPDAIMKICQQKLLHSIILFLLEKDDLEIIYWCVPITDA